MSIFPICRAALRRQIVPVGLSLSTGLLLIRRQTPMRLDARQNYQPLSTNERKEMLNPEVVKQLSSGSVSGFAIGLVVSVFSKTLVLFAGLTVVVIQIAARYGINIVDQLRLKKRAESSRILRALTTNPAFGISFGLTFALSAFASF